MASRLAAPEAARRDDGFAPWLRALKARLQLIARLSGADQAATAPVPSEVLDEPLAALPACVARISATFRLPPSEERAVALALAPLYDREVAVLYGTLSGRGATPCGLTREVLAAVDQLALPEVEVAYLGVLIEPGTALRMRLLEIRDGVYLEPGQGLRSYIAGRIGLPTRFERFARLQDGAPERLVLEPSTQAHMDHLGEVWEVLPTPPLTFVVGPSGSGRTIVARALAARRALEIMEVSLEQVPEATDALELEREARWHGCVLLLRSESGELARRWQGDIARLVERRIPLIIEAPQGLDTVAISGALRGIITARIELTIPRQEERRTLWQRYLPAARRSDDLSDELLAFRFRGTGRDIRQLADIALQRASLENGGSEHGKSDRNRARKVSFELVSSVARQTMVSRLAGVAELLDEVGEGLAAVVLSDHQREQVMEVQHRVVHRRKVLEEWGLGARSVSGLGTVALFSGPPGTGKTLSARAIASELKVPLYRVDLSQIISKWVGETEKHLAGVFDDAERSGAALLFDEADSMFARRTEVRSSNDRYANLEVGYLLQRIDTFTGLCFLTTNLASNLDAAFTRRFAVHVHFGLPEIQERIAIWERHLPATLPLADSVDIEALADEFDTMSGGEIRNATVRAAFIAAAAQRPVTQAMLSYASNFELASSGALVRSEERPRTWGDSSNDF